MVHPAVQRARFLAPGDKLGKHDLIRQIAVGGMAELYLARTMGLEGFEKLVVLKRILPQFADNATFVNMFLNEARLAATLHHPNIAQVYDIGQDDGDYFFSMEYVHGEDLGHLVASATDSGVPISLDAALTLVAGLCAGLHYAHEKAGPDGTPLDVVHRDVSPSNVLVSYDGAVKLVDFGIARAGSNPATMRGGLKGKIAYMSPEQCRGKVALDRRSDVFSIGTILYELTTGRLPFTDETEYGILNQIVNRDAEPPSRQVANYPAALEAILMRALARDVGQRYATALELQKAVEDFAHDNRLRVSPLVLARLMGTLFPTRLEEWDHARAQGAFFVEQHVVRTLIESGKATLPSLESGPVDTHVGPPPADEATQVRGDRARAPSPLPGMPPARGSQPLAPIPPTPPRAMAAPAGLPLPSAPAPLPVAPEPEPLPLPPRFSPASVVAPSPPRGAPIIEPGSVPIVLPLAAPPMAHAGTLASPSAIPGEVDVTQRVRSGRAVAVPAGSETALVQVPRSRMPVILLAAAAALAAMIATFVIVSGSLGGAGGTTPAAPAPSRPAAPEPAAVAPPTAAPPPVAEEAAKSAEPADPAPEPAKPALAGKPPKKPLRVVRPAPKRPLRVVKRPDAKPDLKPDPPDAKEPKWTPDSPFMPVRPPDKK